MRYEIIEQTLVPKARSGRGCEDLLAIHGSYVAVIDGATSKSGRRRAGPADGALVARIIGDTLHDLEAGLSGPALVAALTDRVRAAPGSTARTGAACAILSLGARTVTRVGDITVQVNSRSDMPAKRIDTIVAAARAAYTSALLEGKEWTVATVAAGDPGRRLMLPLLQRQRAFQNNAESPYGYGSIDGTPVPDGFIDQIPVSPGDLLVMATDGYPELGADLAETEALLAADLARDPPRVGVHPATKGFDAARQVSFDDRAYLRLRLRD